MSVVPLTLTISLCLVFTFVLFFMREYSRSRFSGSESEALLPLADETPSVPASAAAVPAQKSHHHGPGHVCHNNGTCASCLRRSARASAATGHHA